MEYMMPATAIALAMSVAIPTTSRLMICRRPNAITANIGRRIATGLI